MRFFVDFVRGFILRHCVFQLLSAVRGEPFRVLLAGLVLADRDDGGILSGLCLRDFHGVILLKKEYKKHTFMSDVRSGGCYNLS